MVILEGSSFRNEELKRERERDEARERAERKRNDDAIKSAFRVQGKGNKEKLRNVFSRTFSRVTIEFYFTFDVAVAMSGMFVFSPCFSMFLQIMTLFVHFYNIGLGKH